MGPSKEHVLCFFLTVLIPAKRLEVGKDNRVNTVLLKFGRSLFPSR